MSRPAAVLLLLAACCPVRGAVVINEILYHAPDDNDALQFVELHNTADKAVDLAGWALAKGVKYTFPAGATLAAGGYAVVCKDREAFKAQYGTDAAGAYEGALGDKGSVELLDARGRTVDAVKYRSRAPWPLAADGYGASIERICPAAPGDPANWSPSAKLGSPGKKNVSYSPTPPPVVSVTFAPTAGPGEEIKVEATVRSAETLRAVELLYRVAGPGSEGKETAVRMTGEAGRYRAAIPAQKAGQIVRFRVRAVDAKKAERFYPDANEVRPALSVFVHEKYATGKIPFGLVINVGAKEFEAARRGVAKRFGAPPSPTPPARGASAFVSVDPKTGNAELFDFVAVTPRTGGFKIRFHKDRELRGVRTANLIYEWNDRFVVAEPLAYDVHRKAGNAAPRTDFVRTWIDGRPVGYQLLVEQPNTSYLKHNGLAGGGNLYKADWMGWNVIGRHEKKTNARGGHGDLLALVSALNRTKGEAQWALIKKEFDAEQVINHYAARTLLSDWDGFFNNYFAYHDVRPGGKWTLHPWDQDKTWGHHDGTRPGEVFSDMPITYGMEGDPRLGGFGFGLHTWWRPGGDLSRPLLANPTFRRHFLARTKELLETVYTQEVIFPLIKALGERLEGEVAVRAELYAEDPKQALRRLGQNLDSLRDHLKKRRQFLLEQGEIKKAGRFDRAALR